MRPIPVDFHIGPLQVHTYGIGLALTFWFGFVYFERRLRKNGYPTDWLVPVFLWIILAAVVGARAMHVLSNLSYYSPEPGRRPRRLARRALVVRRSAPGRARRHHPDPAALPRAPARPGPRPRAPGPPGLLGHGAPARPPAHGGRGRPPDRTSGSACTTPARPGRRLPVPIFQALEDFAVYLDPDRSSSGGSTAGPTGHAATGYPAGTVLGIAMVLWGIERSLDEHLWLGEDGRLGSDLVQLAGVLLVVGGVVILCAHAQPLEGVAPHAPRARTPRPATPGERGHNRPDLCRRALRGAAHPRAVAPALDGQASPSLKIHPPRATGASRDGLVCPTCA